MFDEERQRWLRMVAERIGDSERHRAAAAAILDNSPVPDEHVAAADELVAMKLAFPRGADGTYQANLFSNFRR